ncbi:dynamin family protein [Salana multivorans]
MTTEAQARAHLAAAAARVSRSGTAAAAVAARVVADLESPLRIGVVGRVSAGKSTLVNALLEEDIAPTGAGETTRVPTWFLPSDRWDFAEVVTGDGRRVPLGLEGGRIPLDLPAGVEVSGSAIEVYRQAEVLRSAVIVDTPGTASALSRAGSAGALAAHDSTHRDAARVDALVVVLSRDVGPEDLEVTRALVGTSSPRVDCCPWSACSPRSTCSAVTWLPRTPPLRNAPPPCTRLPRTCSPRSCRSPGCWRCR